MSPSVFSVDVEDWYCSRPPSKGRSLGILEIPISVAKFAGIRIPATGGGYFRHLPYRSLPPLRRLRHYHGIDHLESKLESLLKEFSFTSMRVLFEQIELSDAFVS